MHILKDTYQYQLKLFQTNVCPHVVQIATPSFITNINDISGDKCNTRIHLLQNIQSYLFMFIKSVQYIVETHFSLNNKKNTYWAFDICLKGFQYPD